jgi:TctA family transporter
VDALGGILGGFAVSLTPARVFYCFLGTLLGTVVGVLPGLGPSATIALLLPVTYTAWTPSPP